MPSVEMRRSTRVFVPKTAKDGEAVRVLRSGRRLWVVESDEVKNRGPKGVDDWYPLIHHHHDDHQEHKMKKETEKNGWHEVGPSPMDVDDDNDVNPVSELPSSVNERSMRVVRNVYSRKRKHSNAKCSGIWSGLDKDNEDKKFGLHFVRRKRRRRLVTNPKVVDVDDDNGLLSIVVDSSLSWSFPRLLAGILRGMSREVIALAQLSGFLVSSPIAPVFAQFGICFFWNRPCIERRGMCRIFPGRRFTPLFTVDFSAIPLCFLGLHGTMLFRSMRVSCLCRMDFHLETESSSEFDEPRPVISDQSGGLLVCGLLASYGDVSRYIKPVVKASAGVGRLSSRNVPYRIGVVTRSAAKRRCRSLRSRRARKPSSFVLQNLKRYLPVSPLRCSQELRRSGRRSSASETSVPKPISCSSLSLNVDVDSQCCSANLLVVETDKCYRVEGAEIMLDISESNEWVLAVKKDRSTRYSVRVQREMRPCTSNRYTHAVIWALENGWKLEFPERKDWLVFKELYKACGEKNVVPSSPVVKNIPIPVVYEVTNSWDSSSAPFKMPDSYIRMEIDELSKALSSRTANYDMDSEDEEWLEKFNDQVSHAAHSISEETFELMIDAFEKASFVSPDECADEKGAANLCMDLASSVVAEEVYGYWLRKREQKRGPLLRIFQMNQPQRAEVITKPVLRKKRSLKRQTTKPSQRGRGKDNIVLQAIAAEQSAAEVQSAIERIQEARATANRSTELAIKKRQRAQLLMENADLAMYRATMALRIADAAQVADIQQACDNFLLD